MENKETIEEAAKRLCNFSLSERVGFYKCFDWQQERSYSEEELLGILMFFADWYNNSEIIKPRSLILKDDIQVFISEKFKKK